jgi:hypothetical protein
MSVEFGTEAVQYFSGIFVSNFRYCVFAVQGVFSPELTLGKLKDSGVKCPTLHMFL